MKMLFQIGVVFFGILMTATAYSQNYDVNAYNPSSACAQPCPQQCPPDAPCDAPCGDCWCRYVHYEPCYYQTQRCVEEQIPCVRKCCRMVPQYYQVQKCRYVPQYYCETACRMCPQEYCVNECKTCQRVVCDTNCRYVPRYYWKHTCGDASCPTPCPTTSACPTSR